MPWQGKDIGMEDLIKALFTERKKDIGMEERVPEAAHPTGGGVTVMLDAYGFGAKTVRAPKDELKEYARDSNGEDGAPNLLAWWKLNEHRYPVLATLAKEILGVTAISAPSERIFSKGRQLISQFRHKLGKEMVEAIMCLKTWWDVVPEVDEGESSVMTTESDVLDGDDDVDAL